MNPMYTKIAFSLTRYILIAGGLEGILSDDQLMQIIGAVATVVAVIWSCRKNFRERQLLVTALAAPMSITENEAAALIANPSVITPSVTSPKDEVPR